jgi:hypothetical protein
VLNKDAHVWINQQKQLLPNVERLTIQNGHIFLTSDLTQNYIDLFQRRRSLSLYSSAVSDNVIQYVSSFSCLTSLSIHDLATTVLILNCDRSFHSIKTFRMQIEDLDIDHIELYRLLQVFPHLYGFHIGYILHTHLERLINEKLAGVALTSLRISFRPKDFGKIQKKEAEIGDESGVKNKHDSKQVAIRNELANDAVGWFKNYTFLGNLTDEDEWTAFYYADEREYFNEYDCLLLWH